jgi:hypothetical protein
VNVYLTGSDYAYDDDGTTFCSVTVGANKSRVVVS